MNLTIESIITFPKLQSIVIAGDCAPSYFEGCSLITRANPLFHKDNDVFD